MNTYIGNNDEHKEQVLSSSPAWDNENKSSSTLLNWMCYTAESSSLGPVLLLLISMFLSRYESMFFLGVFSFPAVVLGHLGIRAYKRGDASLKGKRAARVGLIFGYIGTVLALVLTFAMYGFAKCGFDSTCSVF